MLRTVFRSAALLAVVALALSASHVVVNASAAQDRKVIRAGGSVVPRKVHDVPPVYPEEAKAAGVSGVVILDAHIDIEGNVVDTAVLKSIPLLDQAAQEAVLQWKYAPTLLNGEPVDVIITVTINFALGQ